MGCATLSTIPLVFFAWKYRNKLKKMPKSIAALSIPTGLLFWNWLHSVSFAAEFIVEFTIILSGVVIAFLVEDSDFKMDE